MYYNSIKKLTLNLNIILTSTLYFADNCCHNICKIKICL